MDLVATPLSGSMLVNAHRRCIGDCTRVRAAVAYASADNMALFEDCHRHGKPLQFYGRYDGSCPVDPRLLRWFLDRRTPGLQCRLVPRWLHAKVIWWENEGAYIGSANLTDRAWFKNFEAGIFLSDGELRHFGVMRDLEAFFDGLADASRPLSEEMYRAQKQLFDQRRKLTSMLEGLQERFDETDHWVQRAINPIEVDAHSAESRRFNAFVSEWNQTLQHMRDIAERVSDPAVRPPWIDAAVPRGVQADQFLHAYYYTQVRDGLRHPYEEFHARNGRDPEAALKPLLAWWRDGDFDHSDEQTTIYEWAPLIREYFAEDRVLGLSEDEWVAAASRVHAIRDHGTKVENVLLGLPAAPQERETKIDAFCRWLWRQRSEAGRNCLDLVNHVVWGPGEITRRLWDGAHDPAWRLPHLAISSLGEIVGWSNPDVYPPRNMRTSKSLYALGYDVAVSL